MSDLRGELEAIYTKRGQLTPEIVVEEARPRTAPLHSRLTWDNRIAGEAWRRHEAHELIQSVMVVYKKATETSPAERIRAFHAFRTEEGHVYKSNEEVVEDPFLTQLLLRDMEREWKQLHRRYSNFSEFVSMVRDDIEKAG